MGDGAINLASRATPTLMESPKSTMQYDQTSFDVNPVTRTERGARTRSLVTGLADRLLFLPLICLYVFFVQFGTLTRLKPDEPSRGLTTVIVFALIGFGFIRALRGALQEPLFWVIAVLIVYLLLINPLATAPEQALYNLLQLIGYVLLAAVISRTDLGRSRLLALWAFLSAGLFLSAFLSILDFQGIVDVPYSNYQRIETKIGGVAVEQASGFFPSRSQMAGIFSIGIAGSMVLALAHSSLILRLFFVVAGCSGLLCLFLTHNRSGVFGSAIAVATYLLLSRRLGGIRRAGAIVAVTSITLALLFILARYFPDHVAIYSEKLGFIPTSSARVWASDYARLDLLYASMRSLLVRPLGNGLTDVELTTTISMDAHNIITALIWAAGIFSFAWLPLLALVLAGYFGRKVARRHMLFPSRPEQEATSWALLAWLLNGMTHNPIHTGLAWLLIGVIVSRRFFLPRPGIGPTGRTERIVPNLGYASLSAHDQSRDPG